MFIEKAERLPLNVGEQPQTEFSQEPFAGTIDEHVLAARTDIGKNNHNAECRHRNTESRSVLSSDTRVNPKTNK
jgi:hypothetical protein